MNGAVKVLRDGVAGDACSAPLVLIEDTLRVTGGPAAFLHVVQELCNAIPAQRAQCQLVSLAALAKPSDYYLQRCAPDTLRTIDCFSDSTGWNARATPGAAPAGKAESAQNAAASLHGSAALQHAADGNAEPQPLTLFGGDGQGLQRLGAVLPAPLQLAQYAAPLGHGPTPLPTPATQDASRLGDSVSRIGHIAPEGATEGTGRRRSPAGGGRAPVVGACQLCLGIDCLSTLLLRHPPSQVVAMIYRLQQLSIVSSMLAYIHTDLHEKHMVSAVEHLATCVVRLDEVNELQRTLSAAASGTTVNGALEARHLRRSGRVRVEAELYKVFPDGTFHHFAPAPGAVTTQAVSSTAIKATSEQGAAKPAASGGMKLSLSEEERRGRDAVVLPYEHQGSARAYQSGDFRDYLSPAAGGHDTQQRLGNILYVRDSDNDYDSDEDPDDDLDI